MEELVGQAAIENATIFESGYGIGFRQFEVRELLFRLIPLTGGGDYPAATFVERGKRKRKAVQLNHALILKGWNHPALDVTTVASSSGSVTVHHAKFRAFSPGWDRLLDEYLETNGLLSEVVVDGRNRAELAPSRGPARPVSGQTPPTRVADGELGKDGPAEVFAEGSIETLVLDRFERDPQARAACLKHFGYRCQACQILMSDTYGPLGDQYIHVHHKTPLSQIRQEYRVDPTRDLVPVCPNCHSILHRYEPPMTIEALADIVRRRAAQQAVAADGVAAGTSHRIETPVRRRPRC